MLELCRLRIHQKPGRDGEGRPPGGLGEAGDTKRPPNPDWTAENPSRQLGKPG
jgi:hypothetical protein